MEQVNVDGNLSTEAIKETLASMFPTLRVFEWNIFISSEQPDGGEEIEGYESNNPTHVFFAKQFISGRPEFKWQISFFMNVGDDASEREMAIAQKLSAVDGIHTLVGFTHPDYPSNPYYSIVFIDGKSYLADDSYFDFNGDEDSQELIKILGPYQLPAFQFDAMANRRIS